MNITTTDVSYIKFDTTCSVNILTEYDSPSDEMMDFFNISVTEK